MDTVIATIQKTPLPTILILAGLFFILLGFVTKIGGIIEVSTEQKRLAIPIGLLVLIIGLLLTFIPSSNLNTSVQISKSNSSADVQKAISNVRPSATAMSDLEYGTNRFAGDYKNFETKEPQECREACASEEQCVAFSFVKAGIQGANAVCWLKSIVPPPTPDNCCISGFKKPA